MSIKDQSCVSVKVGGQPLSADAYSSLVEARVDLDVDALSMFTLRLDVQEEGKSGMVWVDDSLFAPGTEVELGFGYASSPKSVMKGEITGLELELGADESPKLIVRGYDRLHRLLRNTRMKSYVSMKDSAIAKEIATGAGLTASVTDSQVTHDYVLQDGLSDFDFLKQRAAAIGFAVKVDDKTLYFGPHPYSGSAAATLTTMEDIIDIYLTLDTKGMPGQVTVQGWDPATKKAFTGKATAGDLKAMGKTVGPAAADSAFKAATLTYVNRAAETEAAAKQIALGKLQTVALGYVRGEGTCYGRTDLKAGIVVAIEGLGTRFSGDYYVTSARHIYQPEAGYTTEIDVRRNAT